MRNIRIPQVFTLILKVFISNHLQWYKKETNRQNNDLSLRVPLKDEILNLWNDFRCIVEYLQCVEGVIKLINSI